MKTLSTLFFVMCLTLGSMSQCEIQATISQTSSQICPSDPIAFMGFGNTTCTGVYSINYTWEAYFWNGTEMFLADQVSGNTISPTNIPIYQWFMGNPLAQVCLTLTVIDETNATIASTSTCSSNFFILQPLAVAATVVNNNCGLLSCVQVSAIGGTAPYTFDYGNGQIGNGYFCTEVPGTYLITVIDANGCMAETSITVEESEVANLSCASAIVLEDDVTLSDTLCGISPQTMDCSGIANYYQHGWYTINSGDNTVLNLGVHAGYYSNPTPNTMTGVQITQVETGTDCELGEVIFCETNFNCGSVTVLPNTDYYIHVMTMWTTWSPVQILADLSDVSVSGMCGCTTETSCNYDPEALIEDGSCGYNGCMDQGACNYLSYATCDDGSCIFGSDLTGLIFHDVNGDGVRTTWPSIEPVLGNTGYITIVELGVDVYANSLGEFVLPSLLPGIYHVEYTDPSGAWILSVDSPLEITLPTCSGLFIPLIPSSEVAAQIYGSGLWWNTVLHCTNGLSSGIWVTNTGNVPLNGTATMQYDESLVIGATPSGYIVPTSVAGGLITWNIVDQPVGTTYYYMVHVNGPGAAFVGTTYSFDMSITLTNDGVPFYEESWTSNTVVTCAWDPNDKQAIPEGYSEEHFINADDEIEYRIRFQNTGNAPAFNIHIDDQIDITKLDLSSFVPVGASHSYSTIVNPDGLIRFVFDNIMLPDSFNNEPESHGFVVYKIRPLPQLQGGDVILNTASIYFDDNPAVVTNTYHHTIFECSMIQDLVQPMPVCDGIEVLLIADHDYVDTYEWYLDETLIGTGPTLEFDPSGPGTYTLELVRSNPLCEKTEMIVVTSLELPGTTIVANSWTLTAPEGDNWIWYLNGVVIDGENQQTLNAVEEGTYTVMTTNSEGCSSLSNSLMMVGLKETEANQIRIYPNPADEWTTIALPAGTWSVSIMNSVGEMVIQWYQKQGNIVWNSESHSAGIYQVRMMNDQGETYCEPLVIR